MRKICLCVLVVVLSSCFFAGCATPKKKVWIHPQKNEAGLKQDRAQCDYEIGMADVQKDVAEDKQRTLFDNCMMAKGWTMELR